MLSEESKKYGDDVLLRKIILQLEEDLSIVIVKAEFIKGGIEAKVSKLILEDGSPLLLKFSTHPLTANDNDPDLKYIDLYQQEFKIANWCIAKGIPSTMPLKVASMPFGVSVYLSEYIENDRSIPNYYELGCLVKQLHSEKMNCAYTVAMRGMNISDVVTNLILQRLTVIRKFVGRPQSFPERQEIFKLLLPISERRQLLHMDIRPENVLCINNSPVALIDWSNALVGHPLIEIARIYEYGLLTSEFIRGYSDDDLILLLESPTGLVCRLYTAVMMCVLFLSEVPDSLRASKELDRMEALLKRLNCSS